MFAEALLSVINASSKTFSISSVLIVEDPCRTYRVLKATLLLIQKGQ